MKSNITGKFVMQSYGGLVNEETGSYLSQILENTYKLGAIVTVNMTVEYVGRKPVCKETGKYGAICNNILNDDGTCPNNDRHEVKVTNDEKDDNE